jgi:hypothetical protein
VLLDWGNDRIETLSDGGVTRQIFRAAGAPTEPLVSSSGACTDSAGGIYVADYQRNRVKEYDPRGHLMKTIGNDGGRKPLSRTARLPALLAARRFHAEAHRPDYFQGFRRDFTAA